MSSPSPSSGTDAQASRPIECGTDQADRAALSLADQIDGDDDLLPEPERGRYLFPGPSAFFIGLTVLALLMVIAALLKQMR